MKKILMVLTLAVAVLASQTVRAQEKPAEKKEQKTEQKCGHKKGETCPKCEAKETKEACKEGGCCCKKDEMKKEETKKEETKKDETKKDEKK